MKIRLLYFIILALFAKSVSAQTNTEHVSTKEHIKVNIEGVAKDGEIEIILTIKNTSDMHMRIWCKYPSSLSSYYRIDFYDNNGQRINRNPLHYDIGNDNFNYIVKPNSSEVIKHFVYLAEGSHNRAKKFSVTYNINCMAVNEKGEPYIPKGETTNVFRHSVNVGIKDLIFK